MEGFEWNRASKMKCLLFLTAMGLIVQFSYSFTKIFNLYETVYLPAWMSRLTSNHSIYDGNIPWRLDGLEAGKTVQNGTNPTTKQQLCPLVPPTLVGPLAVETRSRTFEEIEKLQAHLSPGGRWAPRECLARHRVAIIIPYRNREQQLRVLLYHLHPFLQRQQLDYGIFVIDQALPSTFNRALLMNIGYVVSSKLEDYDCFVFHDVDLLPEDDRNLYSCPLQPRHLSIAIDKFHYKLPYEDIFGGATILTKEHMQKTNGFSNLYFGWGGEDDDMRARINAADLKVIRYPMNIGRYRMIKHLHESSNKANPFRFALLRGAQTRYKTDGINSLKFDVVRMERRKLFTWVYVRIDQGKYPVPSRRFPARGMFGLRR